MCLLIIGDHRDLTISIRRQRQWCKRNWTTPCVACPWAPTPSPSLWSLGRGGPGWGEPASLPVRGWWASERPAGHPGAGGGRGVGGCGAAGGQSVVKRVLRRTLSRFGSLSGVRNGTFKARPGTCVGNRFHPSSVPSLIRFVKSLKS